ncbi:hypothetical protein BGZ63DRAFT_426961 [Mariannaea sp. PMI_226]|nr:hypothetical protein BGZ63DRAFT_426961 [Mariannaea sp. PMI_226]
MSLHQDGLPDGEAKSTNLLSSLSLVSACFDAIAQDPATTRPGCYLPNGEDQLGSANQQSSPCQFRNISQTAAQTPTSTALTQKRGSAASEHGVNKKLKQEDATSHLAPCGLSANLLTPDRLACPFYKNDPEKHAYCAKFTYKNWTRIKQHILRSHTDMLEKYRCTNCFKRWSLNGRNSEKLYEDHIRKRGCPRKPRPTLSIEDFEDLEVPNGLDGEIEKWKVMYEKMFPNSPLPRSPFVQDVTTERALSLLEKGQPRLELMLPALLVACGVTLPREVSYSSLSRSICDVLLEDCASGLTQSGASALSRTLQDRQPAVATATHDLASYQSVDTVNPSFMNFETPRDIGIPGEAYEQSILFDTDEFSFFTVSNE